MEDKEFQLIKCDGAYQEIGVLSDSLDDLSRKTVVTFVKFMATQEYFDKDDLEPKMKEYELFITSLQRALIASEESFNHLATLLSVRETERVPSFELVKDLFNQHKYFDSADYPIYFERYEPDIKTIYVEEENRNYVRFKFRCAVIFLKNKADLDILLKNIEEAKLKETYAQAQET